MKKTIITHLKCQIRPQDSGQIRARQLIVRQLFCIFVPTLIAAFLFIAFVKLREIAATEGKMFTTFHLTIFLYGIILCLLFQLPGGLTVVLSLS